MKNKVNQSITAKDFGTHTLYKVYELIEGDVANVRAVSEKDGDFLYAVNLSKKETDFIDDETIDELNDDDARTKVVEALNAYQDNLESNVRKILEATAFVDAENIDIRTIAGHSFTIARDENGVGVPHLQYLYGDANGRVHYHGALPENYMIRAITAVDLSLNPYDDEENQVFQVGPSEYVVLTQYNGFTIAIPFLLQEEKDGLLTWVSNLDYMIFLKFENNGAVRFIEDSTAVFPREDDAQDLLSELTKKVTERVIPPQFVE